MPSYGQGPSISALAQQQQMLQQQQFPQQPPKSISLFIGSISGGISDGFLNELLAVSRSSFIASNLVNGTHWYLL
jgi:RNA-binding protein 25